VLSPSVVEAASCGLADGQEKADGTARGATGNFGYARGMLKGREKFSLRRKRRTQHGHVKASRAGRRRKKRKIKAITRDDKEARACKDSTRNWKITYGSLDPEAITQQNAQHRERLEALLLEGLNGEESKRQVKSGMRFAKRRWRNCKQERSGSDAARLGISKSSRAPVASRCFPIQITGFETGRSASD